VSGVTGRSRVAPRLLALALLACTASGCADEVHRGGGAGGDNNERDSRPAADADLGAAGPDLSPERPDQGPALPDLAPEHELGGEPGDQGPTRDDGPDEPDLRPDDPDLGRDDLDQGPSSEDTGPAGPCGSWQQPCELPELPTQVRGDTAFSDTQQADRYSPCAPETAEDGPEVIYTLVAPADGLLRLTLDDVAGDPVDNDVHLLDAPAPDACLARDNVSLAWRLEDGRQYWIAVDAWFDGVAARVGPFVLDVDFTELPRDGCPEHMARLGGVCMDRYEAPNLPGGLPLVMYTYLQAERWCQQRGKRLCFDDEWTEACQGAAGGLYPYGPAHRPGVCHDEEVWRAYDQALLNGWPAAASAPEIESLQELLDTARGVSAAARAAADHVEWLYQGSGGGEYGGCVNEHGVFDLTGNVEEWTTRRDGGQPSFHGKLKGRYWAETRTCTQGVTSHGDSFRFYEIGFRCCLDLVR